MRKGNYNTISIAHFARQVNVNVITETEDFIVSKHPTHLEEHAFELDHPQIIEGIAFVFCIRGKFRIRINFNEYEICEDSVVVAAPNNILQILEQSPDMRLEFLFFTFDFISNIPLTKELGSIIKKVEENAEMKLDKDDFKELLTIHELIVRQYKKPAAKREPIVKNLLYALIYQLLHQYDVQSDNVKDKPVGRKQDIYTKFMALLSQHYRTERSVKFYADKLYLTPKHLSKVIVEASGKFILEWIDELVIMAAKSLLKSSDMTVAQIADELNFANPSFFGAYFRKRVGITPKEYRQK